MTIIQVFQPKIIVPIVPGPEPSTHENIYIVKYSHVVFITYFNDDIYRFISRQQIVINGSNSDIH